MSLRRRLFLIFFSMTITPILALGALLTWQSYRTQQAGAIKSQEHIAAQIAIYADDFLRHNEENAVLFFQSHNLFGMERNEQKILLTQYMHLERDVEDISLIDGEGREILHISGSKVITNNKLRQISDNPEFKIPFTSGSAYYTPIWISKETNEPITTISIPILNLRNGQVDGVLIVNTNLKKIWGLVEKKSKEFGHDIFIIAADGQIIAHPNRSIVLSVTKYKLDSKAEIARGLNKRISIIGAKEFVVGEQKFTVIAEQPIDALFSQLTTSLATIALTIFITTGIVFFLSLRFGKSISQPIVKLAQQAQAIESGDLDQHTQIDTKDEIGLLASAFNSMAKKLRGHITTLTALQEATLAIVSNLELDLVLQAIMLQTTELLNTKEGFIYLIEPDNEHIRLHLGTGMNLQYIGMKITRGEGLAGAIWKYSKPLVIQDYQNWSGRSEKFKATAFHAIAGVPLISSGKTLGVLGIDHLEPNVTISTEEIDLLEKFAQLAAIAIENARLYKNSQDENNEREKAENQTRKHLERIKSLRSVDVSIAASTNIYATFKIILKEIIANLGIHAADILLLNPATNTFEYSEGAGFDFDPKTEPMRAQEGLAGLAVKKEKNIYIKNLSENNPPLSGFADPEENFVSYYGIPLFIKGEIRGMLELYHRTTLELNPENMDFLESLAGQAAIAIDNYSMFHNLQQKNMEMHLAYETTLEGWSAALDLRDKETEGHTLRVTDLTLKLARIMQIPDTDIVHIKRGALLHDIGKMGIPDSILQKPGGLTAEERKIIEQHPIYAYNLLSPIPYLYAALDIPYCHHEKWDGTGYPRKLKGEAIPYSARIFAIADVYDAVTSNRPYRTGWNVDKALEYIQSESGSHFEPRLANAFIKMMREEN